MIDPAKQSMPHQTDSLVVHWLNAVNPDLFPEQAIRYVKNLKTPSYHPVDIQYMHICMFTHKLTYAHSRVCEAISHTPPPTVWRTICACVWSYSLILYGRICNQTSPLLRASSLSCLSNLTQMQAEKENNEK